MGYQKGPDDSPAPSSPESGNNVVSLRAHRRRRSARTARDALIPALKTLHRTSIDIHNRLIDRADISVLTELCRTTGLFLDLIDEHTRNSVVIPASLYGRCTGEIFGKRPLQKRIADEIDDPESGPLFQKLCEARYAVWEYEPSDDTRKTIRALAGAHRETPQSVAGVIERAGRVVDDDGLYAGWEISFRDHRFVVFGHRLRCESTEAVRRVFADRDDIDDDAIWRRVRFDLLRAVVDPTGRHCLADSCRPRCNVRRPATRNALLLAIRRAIWRHFAEPGDGLTLHAHIAALADDREGFDALIDEMHKIVETTTIRLGGLRDGASRIDLDEILAPFYADSTGRLLRRDELPNHPVAVLLVDEWALEVLGLDGDESIGEALHRARQSANPGVKRAVELAWMTYRSEQALAATYGLSPSNVAVDLADIERPKFARCSAVYPNIWTLSDPRFPSLRFGDLELDEQHRLDFADAAGFDPDAVDERTLAEIGRKHERPTRVAGLQTDTRRALRLALLQAITRWRFRRCGLQPG